MNCEKTKIDYNKAFTRLVLLEKNQDTVIEYYWPYLIQQPTN